MNKGSTKPPQLSKMDIKILRFVAYLSAYKSFSGV